MSSTPNFIGQWQSFIDYSNHDVYLILQALKMETQSEPKKEQAKPEHESQGIVFLMPVF